MKESGQLNRLWNKWGSKFRTDCLANDNPVPLSMGDVYMAFVFLLMAFGFAVLLVVIEKLKFTM